MIGAVSADPLTRIAPPLCLYPDKARRFRGLPGVVATPCLTFGVSSLRSSYEVTVDGRRRALIGYRGGERGAALQGWRIFSLDIALKHYGTRQLIRPREVRSGIASLREAVLLVPALVEEGRLPLAEEVLEAALAADAENDRADAARSAARAAKVAADAEGVARRARENDEIRQALAAVRDRLSADLTNFEASGLELAIRRFGGE